MLKKFCSALVVGFAFAASVATTSLANDKNEGVFSPLNESVNVSRETMIRIIRSINKITDGIGDLGGDTATSVQKDALYDAMVEEALNAPHTTLERLEFLEKNKVHMTVDNPPAYRPESNEISVQDGLLPGPYTIFIPKGMLSNNPSVIKRALTELVEGAFRMDRDSCSYADASLNANWCSSERRKKHLLNMNTGARLVGLGFGGN